MASVDDERTGGDVPGNVVIIGQRIDVVGKQRDDGGHRLNFARFGVIRFEKRAEV